MAGSVWVIAPPPTMNWIMAERFYYSGLWSRKSLEAVQ
jgi:hypothetical protein